MWFKKQEVVVLQLINNINCVLNLNLKLYLLLSYYFINFIFNFIYYSYN